MKSCLTAKYRAVPQLKRSAVGFPPRRAGFDPRSGHVEFVVDNVALGQVFSEYFNFPCQFSFHRLPHPHYLLSGAGTVGWIMAGIPKHSVSPQSKEIKKWKGKVASVHYDIKI
jgi:hypothetical protein